MPEADKPSCTYFLLIEHVLRSKHAFAGLVESHGLTGMQGYTLCLIPYHEERSMSAICALLACDASNVTGIVDKLVTQGMLHRRENPQDRRVKMVALTERGAEIRTQIMRDLVHIEAEALAPLTAAEITEFRRLLVKIVPDASHLC